MKNPLKASVDGVPMEGPLVQKSLDMIADAISDVATCEEQIRYHHG